MKRLLGVLLATALTLGGAVGLALTTDVQSASAAPTSSELNSARQAILRETNAARAGKGLRPLVLNASLNTVAQNWTKHMSDTGTMSHNPSYFQQYPAGATSGAENVAYGYSVAAVTGAWLKSSGHYRNIMSTSTDIGIGYYYGANGVPYYTQNFAYYSTTKVAVVSSPGKGNFTGDARADVVARDASGYLWIYPGAGSALGSRVRVGSGWNGMTAITAGGDFTGDGRADLVARDSGGYLWVYPGTGSGFGSRLRVGNGWNGMSTITAGGDFSGDGRADVLARDTGGYLWMYPGTGSGFGARVRVGIGWNGMTALLAGGDFSGDGRADVVARDTGGYLWVYPGTGAGFGPRVRIGNSWNGMTAITAGGDSTGDGRADVVARDASGYLWLYPGTGSGLGSRLRIGNSWNGMTAIL